MQFLHGTVEKVLEAGVAVRVPGATPEIVDVPCAPDGLQPGAPVEIGIRPEDLTYGGEGPVTLAATTSMVEYMGHASHWHGELTGQDSTLIAYLDRALHVGRGDAITFSIDPADLYLFDEAGKARHRLHLSNRNLDFQLAAARGASGGAARARG
jgi:ABC-type sugar transport system ATPase subunit